MYVEGRGGGGREGGATIGERLGVKVEKDSYHKVKKSRMPVSIKERCNSRLLRVVLVIAVKVQDDVVEEDIEDATDLVRNSSCYGGHRTCPNSLSIFHRLYQEM